ncbi:hypothetical protein AVEN_164481-1 [Araneus ventricosus]|uniref:Uncharacterized protein n=1 Tax=Araneus ventricosus TaxID=182803 RepID=A0A4Y2IPI4_ARAVE|nr:hypothetical protein AVEN_164481-1 [Araneus ventricosus]
MPKGVDSAKSSKTTSCEFTDGPRVLVAPAVETVQVIWLLVIIQDWFVYMSTSAKALLISLKCSLNQSMKNSSETARLDKK